MLAVMWLSNNLWFVLQVCANKKKKVSLLFLWCLLSSFYLADATICLLRSGQINVIHFWLRSQMPWKSWILGLFEPMINLPQLPQFFNWSVWNCVWGEKPAKQKQRWVEEPKTLTKYKEQRETRSLHMFCFPLLLAKHCVMFSHFCLPCFMCFILPKLTYCFVLIFCLLDYLYCHMSLFITATFFFVFSWTISDM